MGAACLVVSMFLGAILLADIPAVRAIRSGFEKARESLSVKSDIEIYESLEELSNVKELTLPRLMYLPEGFTLSEGVRYQEYDGAPVITLSYVKDDNYLTIGIEEVLDDMPAIDRNSYTLLKETQDIISVISQNAPYAADVYIGGYVYSLVGSLSKEEMEKVALGVDWPI